MERKGDWLQTYTGGKLWPLDPRPEDINIEDIAHALSLMCRFGGHCSRFYSVAQHSVLMSYRVPAEHALWALLHDASEAYIVDVPRPVKAVLTGYKDIEAGIMRAVCQKFGLPEEMPAEVKKIDNEILRDEADYLFDFDTSHWRIPEKGCGAMVSPWPAREAKLSFLSRFSFLYDGA